MSRALNVFVNIGGKLLPSLNSSASAVEKRFGLMSRRLKVRAAETKAAWRSMSMAASPLMGMAAAGGLMFTAKEAIGDSAKLAHELQLLRNAGRSARDVASAMAQANRTISALPTTTLEDNLRVLNETTGAFGDFQHALDNLTFNQRIGSMMQNMLGDKAGSPGEMFNAIVRSMEMRGAAQDHKRYQREVGELYKGMVFTRGNFNPEEFLAYSQQTNPYTKGMSLRYLSRIAPSLVQEFGGDRAGTMQNTWMGTILGKAKNKISTEMWMKMGLLDPKQVVYNKVGPVGWRPGAIKGTDLAMQDPLKWSETVLIPALKAHGYDTKNQLSLAKALMPLFRDRNANRLASTLVYDADRQRLHKDERLINQVPGANAAYKDSLNKDPTLAWQAVKSSLTNLLGTMFGTGKGDNPVAVALVHIANGINMVAQAFQAHPWLGKGVGTLLLGATGIATLKMFGIGLRWALSPLKWLLFTGGPKKIGIVGWILRGLMKGFRLVGPLIARLGPLILRGFMMLAPIVMEGIGAAFALLSNPVGWAIMAVIALALIWRFRHEIANFWRTKVVPWFASAWASIKAAAMSINWGSVGMWIADKLTFGLASKFAAGIAKMRASGQAAANVGMNSTRGGMAGMRANGGPVLGGRTYLVGERGPELFRAPRSGRIIPSHHISAMARRHNGGPYARSGGVHVENLNINGAQDPHAVALAVRRELNALANGQAALLSD